MRHCFKDLHVSVWQNYNIICYFLIVIFVSPFPAFWEQFPIIAIDQNHWETALKTKNVSLLPIFFFGGWRASKIPATPRLAFPGSTHASVNWKSTIQCMSHTPRIFALLLLPLRYLVTLSWQKTFPIIPDQFRCRYSCLKAWSQEQKIYESRVR